MPSSTTPCTPVACLAVASILAAGSTASLANVYGHYTNNNDFMWAVSNMPDFDQKRAATFQVEGLPGNGSMYCVPTSTMNLFAYVARHGYPGVNPGINNYSGGDPVVYGDVTANIDALGVLMSTSATGGTGAQGWYDGTRAWLSPANFDLYQRFALEHQPTTSRYLAEIGHAGGLTVFCYGRWENVNGSTLTERGGGHCVTTTRAEKIPPFINTVSYRDPGSGGASEFTQSEFAVTTQNLSDQVFTYDGGMYTMSKMVLNPVPEDGRHRLIDKIYAIFPKQGLTNWPSGGLSLITPDPIDPDQPSVVTFQAPGGPVGGCGTSPSRTFSAYFALGDDVTPPGLFLLDPITGAAERQADLSDPQDLAFSRDERLYVLDGRQIKQYEAEPSDTAACRNNLRQIGIALHTYIDTTAVDYDDAEDQLLMLANNPPALVEFDADLANPTARLLPTPLAAQTLDILAIRPTSPYAGSAGLDVLLGSAGADRLWQIGEDASGALIIEKTWTAPQGNAIQNIVWADHDRAVVTLMGTDGRQLAVTIKEGPLGFVEDPDAPFNNVEVGSSFDISRDRSNYLARIHGTPGWNTDTPVDDLLAFPETPDCPGDWNADMNVDVFDLLAYLDDWFTSSSAADLDLNTTTDVFDLLAYLDLWFAGC